MATRTRRVTACQQNHSQWQDEIEGSAFGINDQLLFCGYPHLLQYLFLQNELLCVQAWHDVWRLSFPNVQHEHRLKDWYKNSPMTADLLQWW